MGLMNFIRGEFIDVIEWVDETNDTLLWKFPRFQNAIKNGAQLTVRESQMAIFMDEGKFADVYGPGRYTLTTQNMPLLTTLRSWKHGFNSPFKVDVIFVNTKQFLNQKWGTKQPILLRDPEFGPIRIRAFGSFAFRVDEDPKTLITEIAGTNPDFTTEEISVQIRNFIVTRFTDAVAESKLPVLDMASNLNEYSEKIQEILKPSVSQYGLKLTTFLVENISLPEAVQEALDRRASMGIIGKENMGTYTQMQFADSMGKGGEAGAAAQMAQSMMGMGMGMAMAGQMAGGFGQQQPQMQQPMQGQPYQQPYGQPMQQPMGGAQVPPPMPGAMPPPIPGAMPALAVHVAVNGAQQGPFNLAQLQQMVQAGQLTPATMVWMAGLQQWTPASGVPALAVLFQPTPPPIN
ncbi:MAG: SPFH domain-containing protein [Bacteroides sp.]